MKRLHPGLVSRFRPGLSTPVLIKHIKMNESNSLVWFRRDLRAFDQAALYEALAGSGRVFCAFVYDTDILQGLPRDDARLRFIHASLASLDSELRRLGGYLIVRHGRAAEAIPALAA